jgi:hypothetical protein
MESAKLLLNEMSDNEFYIGDVKQLLQQILSDFEQRDYESVQELYNQLQQIRDNAVESNDMIASLDKRIYRAINFWGLSTDKTSRIMNLAKIAFVRGDYTKALKRITEAQLTFALETKGEYNIPFIIITYWYYILFAVILSAIVLYFGSKRIRLALLNHKIKSLIHEEQVLLGLMKVLQKDTFEKKKLSMSEYNNTMLTYSKRLNGVVKDIIKYETIRSHIFKFKGERKMLLDERKKLISLIKQTQHKYLTKGKYETRVYMNKMRAYTERLSEIQERLSTLEAKQALKKKRVKFLKKRKKSGKK